MPFCVGTVSSGLQVWGVRTITKAKKGAMKQESEEIDESVDRWQSSQSASLAGYGTQRGSLIPALAAVQAEHGYLPEQAMAAVSRRMGISESEVYGVATFYAQFRFWPPGEHTLKVCMGTACHVRGGSKILETVQQRFGVRPGETSEDRKLSLERVACIGCCALAPAVVLDGKIHGKMTPKSVDEVLSRLLSKKQGK